MAALACTEDEGAPRHTRAATPHASGGRYLGIGGAPIPVAGLAIMRGTRLYSMMAHASRAGSDVPPREDDPQSRSDARPKRLHRQGDTTAALDHFLKRSRRAFVPSPRIAGSVSVEGGSR